MRRFSGFFLGCLFATLVMELAFRMLPVSSATHTGYYINASILTYPPFHEFRTATGWDLKNAQQHRVNNLGFLANQDFVRDSEAIALIGDSFVEANMLPAAERIAAQLSSTLGGRKVFALGGPGSSLLDYAERAVFAAQTLDSRTFVFVLEQGDVRQSLCGSGNIHGPCVDRATLELKHEPQQAPGTVKRIFRESGLAQYVFSQLKFDLGAITSKLGLSGEKADRKQTRTSPEAYAKVTKIFFDRLADVKGGRFVFLVDPERSALFGESPGAYGEMEMFKTAVSLRGMEVVDPSADFRQYVRSTGNILEVGPYDKHWNRNAVRIVSEKVAHQLALSR